MLIFIVTGIQEVTTDQIVKAAEQVSKAADQVSKAAEQVKDAVETIQKERGNK